MRVCSLSRPGGEKQRKFERDFGQIAPGETYINDYHAAYRKSNLILQVCVCVCVCLSLSVLRVHGDDL